MGQRAGMPPEDAEAETVFYGPDAMDEPKRSDELWSSFRKGRSARATAPKTFG
jgi:hypothetical protein